MSDKAMAADLAGMIAQAGAACAGQHRLWTRAERAWSRAQSTATAVAAAAPALRMCTYCPVIAWCHLRAETDGYSGLAAGGAYSKGNRRPVARSRTREPGLPAAG